MDEYELQVHDPANETVNFGSQNVGNDLYEAVTILSVPHLEGNYQQQKICSLSHDNKLYFSVDNVLWIIDDLEEPNDNFKRKFDSTIDVLQVISNHLLVGMFDGTIDVLQINTRESVAVCSINQSVWMDSKYFIGLYSAAFGDESYLSFYALDKKGSLHKFDINHEFKSTFNLVVEFGYPIHTAGYHNDRIIGIGSKCAIYDIYEDILQHTPLLHDFQIIKVWPRNGTSFIALSSNGLLHNICAITLLRQELASFDRVQDFIYYYHPVKCYMLYNSLSDGESGCVNFIQMKDKEIVFKISTDNVSQLTFNTEESGNQIYITNTPESIRIHIVKEASLEGRLQRLIRKGRFIEAEQFACKYKVSKMAIDKAKVLKQVSTSNCSDDEVEELLALMAKIPDKVFVVKNCLNMSCETIVGFERVLKHALSLDLCDFNDHDIEMRFQSTVLEFEAYKVLVQAKNGVMLMDHWQQFKSAGGLHVHLKHALSSNDLEAAIILYRRLCSHFFNIGNIRMVLSLLDAFTLNEYVSFLYTMIPKTMRYLQAALPLFVAHVIDKTHCLEQQARREVEFPECAISLIDSVLNIFEISTVGNMCLSCDDMEEMSQLGAIRQCLDTILELKIKFGKYLPLRECLQGPGAILRVLLKANISELDKFLSDFLVPFMIRNGFDADDVLACEVRDLLTYNETDWAPIVASIWQSVTSLDVQLNLALDILQSASKPWCKDVRLILKRALELKHPLVQEIEVEAKNEPKYIVLCHPAYDLKHETLASVESDMVVARRIIERNQPSMIEDIYTLYTSEEQRCEATYFMIVRFIQRDEFERALYLLKTHNADKMCSCSERFLRFHIDVMFMRNANSISKLLPFVKYMEKQCADSDNLYNKMRIENLSLAMSILDALPFDFFNNAVFSKLQSSKGRAEMLNKFISHLCTSYHNLECDLSQLDIGALVHDISKYAEAFDVPPERILFHLCEESENFALLQRSAEYVNEHSTDLKTMCWMTTLILRSVGSDGDAIGATFLSETISPLFPQGPPVEEQVYINCLRLARKIIVKACLESNGDGQIANVANWALATSQLVEQSCLNTKRFRLNGDGMHTTLNMVRQVFTTYSNYLFTIASGRHTNEYLTRGAKIEAEILTAEQLNCDMINRFHLAIPRMLQENNFWTIQKLLIAFCHSMQLPWKYPGSMCENYASLLSFTKNKFISKAFSAKDIDESFLYYLLISYPRKKGLKILKDAIMLYKSNISKFESLVRLGMNVNKFYQAGDSYGPWMLCIKWWKVFKDGKIEFKDFSKVVIGMEDVEKVLSSLIQQKQITFAHLPDFCRDFKLDSDEYFLKYLRAMLSTWKPVYEICTSSHSSYLNMKSSEEALINDCMTVVRLIGDKDATLKCINQLWESTNFYYYEIYFALLTMAEHFNNAPNVTYKTVLQFLRNYSRSSTPGIAETEAFATFRYDQPLDPLSEFRFPCTPVLFTDQLWTFLRHEINLGNYLKWFALINILKDLSKSDICACAIKSVVFAQDAKNKFDESAYNLQAKYDHIFSEVDICIGHISDPLLAASIAFTLIAKTPDGADKVTAVKTAFKYAKAYSEVSSKIDSNYENIHNMYYNYLSKHILHEHGLDKPDYTTIVDHPQELIKALYRDERILATANMNFSNCPNINAAVNDLGKLFQLDIRSLRKEMLHNLLCDKSSMGDLNESVFLMPDVNVAVDENVDSVMRAAYICSGHDSQFWSDYLYKLALSLNGKFLFQGRVLKTFCTITSPREVVKCTETSYNMTLLSIEKCFLMHDLQTLGIKIDLERLESMPKDLLLHKLGKYAMNPLYIKAMVTICLIYEIFDLNVWRKIMPSMVNFKMICDLKSTLSMFCKHDIRICSPFYIKAWQCVIDHMFEELENLMDDDNDKKLIEAVHYVQACPVLNQLNHNKAYTVCNHLKKYAFAALFIQYMTEDDQNDKLANLFENTSKETLLVSLQQLANLGFSGLQYVAQLIHYK